MILTCGAIYLGENFYFPTSALRVSLTSNHYWKISAATMTGLLPPRAAGSRYGVKLRAE